MTCGSVKDWLLQSRAFATTEVEAASAEVVDHLATCPACQAFQQQDIQFDKVVHAAIQQVTVPISLAEQINWQLRVARRQRQRSRTLHWSMAAAASFLLALFLGWYVQRPYDLVRLHDSIDGIELRRFGAEYVPDSQKQPGDLKQWLQRQGVAVSIPARLKLQHLSSAYLVESAGRKVAVLEMRAGSSTSKICLLQRRYFNERQQQHLIEQGALSSFVIADHDDSDSIGWMIVDQGSAHLFVDGMLPVNGA
jgi:hypothetical protein